MRYRVVVEFHHIHNDVGQPWLPGEKVHINWNGWTGRCISCEPAAMTPDAALAQIRRAAADYTGEKLRERVQGVLAEYDEGKVAP